MIEQPIRFYESSLFENTDLLNRLKSAFKSPVTPEPSQVPSQSNPGEVELTLPVRTTFDFKWSQLWKFMGPGFLISIAYIDPGNMNVDIQAGSRFGYSLLWVVIASGLLGFQLQYLAMKVGVVSGCSLGELSKTHYRAPVSAVIWLMTEVSIVCSDIPQVLGSAYALKILFGLPIWFGVLLSFVSVLLLLFSEFLPMRKIEIFVAVMIGLMLFCVFGQLFYTKINLKAMSLGFVPNFPRDSLYLLMAFIGSVVMPYNFFLHSSLVNTRSVEKEMSSRRESIFYNVIEFAITFFICAIINIILIILSVSEFRDKGEIDAELTSAPRLISKLVGGFAPILFALSLMASSQSGIISTTLAGQFVMNDFIKLKVPPSTRAFMTRAISVVPTLILISTTTSNTVDNLLISSQAILSFLLPFPLITLVKFSSSRKLMRSFRNSNLTICVTVFSGVLLTFVNLGGFWSWTINLAIGMSHLSKIIMTAFVSLTTVSYIAFLLFLVFYKENIDESGLFEKDFGKHFTVNSESEISVYEGGLISESDDD